jgi:hypothetical protein
MYLHEREEMKQTKEIDVEVKEIDVEVKAGGP